MTRGNNAWVSVSCSRTRFDEDLLRPSRVVAFQRGLRRNAVVDVIVAGLAIALLDERLQGEPNVGVRRPQRYLDRGKRRSKADRIILELARLRHAMHTSAV